MSREIIYKGIKIPSNGCKYFKVQKGSINSLTYNDNIVTLTYTNPNNKLISDTVGLKLVGKEQDISETNGSVSFKTTTITLNGLTLEKLTYDPHIINIVIVDDLDESRVVQTYERTTIVVKKEDRNNPEFIKFLFYSNNLLYLKPTVKYDSSYVLMNFPKILLSDSNTTLTSTNDTVFKLRRGYNDYVIREIDYQDQFILELRKILDDYGVELVRINKETTLSNTSYITYQFTQTPVLLTHPFRREYDRNILSYRQPIEFTFHTTDMILYHDFKNRYINVSLLTNFTEYKATDKYGGRWTASARWAQITEDFNHTYQLDDNSNFALQCQFRCELFFYEVVDKRFEILDEIATIIENNDIV